LGEKEMRRIKIIKIFEQEHYDYENTDTLRTIAEGIDWHEVDDNRYLELARIINFANQNRYQLKADYLLQMIEEVVPASIEVHLEKAKALYDQHQEKLRKQKEKEEKARIAREEKRKSTEIERKRKQLEKLQKELGENESNT
jgi:hypothetical protein